MKATLINGIVIEGTPDEITKILQLDRPMYVNTPFFTQEIKKDILAGQISCTSTNTGTNDPLTKNNI